MNAIVQTINSIGRVFAEFALPMLIQSSVLVVLLLLVDLLLRRKVRAVFRYWIWLLVLVKLVLPPSLGSPVSFGTWFGHSLEVPVRAMSDRVESAAPSPQRPFTLPVASSQHFFPPERPQPSGEFTIAPAPIQQPEPVSAVQAPAEPVPTLSWQGLALVVWAMVAFVLLLLLVQRGLFVSGLAAQADASPASLRETLEACCARMGFAAVPAIRISTNATSPAVCGLTHPTILIPRNLVGKLACPDLEAVLLHELAHVKRGDLWINLLQTLLQVVYFYNPLLWLANAMIRRVREKAVDEAVLVAMGESAEQYPETLLNIAKLAFRRRPALSLRLIGVVESKSALRSRIKHMLTRPMPKTAKLSLFGIAVLLVIAAVLLPMAKGRPLTERARNVTALAREEARALNHDYVGTEHILLALARQEDAVSTKVLWNLGAGIADLRAEVEKFVQPGDETAERRPLRLTPRAQQLFDNAAETAAALGHSYIGTEHILLALADEEQGVGAEVLGDLGLTRAQIHNEILQFVRPGNGSPAEGRTSLPETWTEESQLALQRALIHDRMPLPTLTAQTYYEVGEPVWVYFQSAGGNWKPRLEEMEDASDTNVWFVAIDGIEYECDIGFGTFGGIGAALEFPDALRIRAIDFRLPPGKHTIAYGWREIDVIDPNDPDNSVHFDRLLTDPAEIEVVEQIPADYYRPVYEESWEAILGSGVEAFFTDDTFELGVAGTLLTLRVGMLPFDLAFDVYAQAEGSEQLHPTGKLTKVAGSIPSLYCCDRDVPGLGWDTVGDRRWRVVLKPSAQAARERPPIHEFYAREFVTDWLTFERSARFEQRRRNAMRRQDVPDAPRGRIVDSQGNPIVGATVDFQGWDEVESKSVNLGQVTTTSDGYFTAPPVDPGKHIRLTITAAGYCTYDSVDLGRRTNGSYWPEGLTFTLWRTGTVEGTVLGPDGLPLAGAPLSLTTTRTDGGGVTSNHLRAVTDEAGRFRIDSVPPGIHLLYYPWSGPTQGEVDSGRWQAFQRPGQRWPSAPVKGVLGGVAVELDEDEEVTDASIDLSKSTCTIEGQVRDAAGRLVAGAAVEFTWKITNGSISAWGRFESEGYAPAVTDSQGRYRMTGLPPGDWHIKPSHPAISSKADLVRVHLYPGRTVQQDLHLPGRLPPDRIAVLPSAADVWGAPVDGIRCRLTPDKTVWTSGEVPTFKVEARNDGASNRMVFGDRPVVVEVDGEWFMDLSGGAGVDFLPGQVLSDLSIPLDRGWIHMDAETAQRFLRTRRMVGSAMVVSASSPEKLTLAPGRHVVRVAMVTDSRTVQDEPVRPAVSNPVEIEIVSTGTGDIAWAGDIRWGAETSGLKLGVDTYPQRGPVQQGDTLRCNIYVGNVGTEPVTLVYAVGRQHEMVGGLTVVRDRAGLTNPAFPANPIPTGQRKELTVNPGGVQHVGMTALRIDPKEFPPEDATSPQPHCWLPPDAYEVSYTCRFQDDPAATWQGWLASGPLAFEVQLRQVYLPDLETPDANVVLDLATGQLLSAEPMRSDERYYQRVGKGDLVCENAGNRSGLMCLRGATLQRRTETGIEPLTPDYAEDSVTGYYIDAPASYQVTTAEGGAYDLTVLSIDPGDHGGIWVEYESQVPSSLADMAETEWGRSDDGVRLRLRPRQVVGAEDQPLQLALDLRNDGPAQELSLQRLQLELDGVAYSRAHADRPSANLQLATGATIPGLPIELGNTAGSGVWRSIEDPRRIAELTPGMHTVCVIDTVTFVPNPSPVVRRSNPVELEILPAEASRADSSGVRSGLELRVAPKASELAPDVLEACRNAPTAGPVADGQYLWWQVRPGTNVPPDLVVQERAGRRLLLLFNDETSIMVPGQGWSLTQAERITDRYGRLAVSIRFDDPGAERFFRLTQRHVRQTLAIIVDGTVISTPNVMEPMGAAAVITGAFTEQDIAELIVAMGFRALAPLAPSAERDISGQVAGPDGGLVAGVQVALCGGGRRVRIEEGVLEPPQSASSAPTQIVETDAAGRYRFDVEPNDGMTLVAAHDVGFALVDLADLPASGEIRLAPWGRIEGYVAEGRYAVENQVWISATPNPTWPSATYEYRDQTRHDSDKRFVFEKVPTGWFEVGYLTAIGELTSTLTSSTPVEVRPGQTATLTLGGEGRPVIGHFVPPTGYDEPIYFGQGLRVLSTKHPDRPRPANYDQMTRSQQAQWNQQWYQTPEAQAWFDAVWHDPTRRQYAFYIDVDGTFRIEDVIAGIYEMNVDIEGPISFQAGRGQPRENLGGYFGTIEIPTIPGGQSDEPFDLGDLVLRMGSADDAEAATPAVAEMPEGLEFLQAIPEFRGLRLDMTEDDLQRYIQQHSLAFRRAASDDMTSCHLFTEGGENVIVMFRSGECSGIQRMRPDQQEADRLYEQKRRDGSLSSGIDTQGGLQVYDVNGVQIEAGFVLDKVEIILGEPLFVTFRVTNLSDELFQFRTGGAQRSVRDNSYSIKAVDEAGQGVADPYSSFNLGGPIGFQTLAKGQTYTKRLFLGHWCAFDKPGQYRLTCRRSLHSDPALAEVMGMAIDSPAGTSVLRIESSPVLNVVPYDARKMQAVIADLQAKLDAGRALRETSLALSFIDSPEAGAPQ